MERQRFLRFPAWFNRYVAAVDCVIDWVEESDKRWGIVVALVLFSLAYLWGRPYFHALGSEGLTGIVYVQTKSGSETHVVWKGLIAPTVLLAVATTVVAFIYWPHKKPKLKQAKRRDRVKSRH